MNKPFPTELIVFNMPLLGGETNKRSFPNRFHCIHQFTHSSSSSSSSSCHDISTDILDPFWPPFSIIHCFRSSGLHPVSAQSCCIYVLVGHPAIARLCEGVCGSASLMSSPLHLQQCFPCLVHLTVIVFMKCCKWP